ncbi:MAG: LysE family translocator [Caenispirillum bisanense]|nr:LysE family translocator [Caenispirillum bisanense]MCA1974949.1 LysE family translocator [Caenispirillum sp.]
MTLHTVAALLATCFLAAVLPGPGTVALSARVMAQGVRRSLVFVAGMLSGDVVWIAFAVTGLTVIAKTLGPLFLAVKIAGGLYLVWLGIKLLRTRHDDAPDNGPAAVPTEPSAWRTYLSGLALMIGNPKVMLFYVSVLPTVIDLHSLSLPGLIATVGVIGVGVGGGLVPWIVTASRLRGLMRSAVARRRIDRGAGVVMVGAGAAVAAT